MSGVLRIGMVGAGNISKQYLAFFDRVETVRLVAVADLNAEAASAVAAAREGCRALSVDDLVADPEVDVVLNLTIPAAHAPVALQAIAHGKGVYGEKPLAATLAEAEQVMSAASAAGVLVGCAPDTVLGTGIQTARKAIDDGLIGAPIAASAVMVTAGHERWHPNPDFYYLPGGGPLLDMGPYYVTALVQLLGPVTSVVGAASRSRDSRTIGSGARAGQVVPVEIDTHVSGVLTHASGVLSTITMSFDSTASRASRIEVHGTGGSLVVPDPNRFDGDVELNTGGEWAPVGPSAGYVDAGRGVGLVDWAQSSGVGSRASGEVAFHVLDIMESLLASAGSGSRVEVTSSVERPSLVPLQDPR